MNNTPRIALLIDADNISPAVIAPLLGHAEKLGYVTIRRAYGDWTRPELRGWKDVLHLHAIQPVQQFANRAGKNATDSALIIDAMDILYTVTVDGFCLASSDSDFTRLATRLREGGKTVQGVGQRSTPIAFTSACTMFAFIKDFTHKAPPPAVQAIAAKLVPPDLQTLLTQAIREASPHGNWIDLSRVGIRIRQSKPGFDPRVYGAKTLKALLQGKQYLEWRQAKNHHEVRLRVRAQSDTEKTGG